MLRYASWFVALSHVGATMLAAVVIRPGTPDAGDASVRAAYVAANTPAWIAGWLAFVIAGGGLLVWVVLLRAHLDPERRTRGLWLAVVFTAVGLALECVAHGLSMGLLPTLTGDLPAFETTERVIRMFGLVLGQLGFAGGTLLVVRALAEDGLGGRAAVLAGYANVTFAAATIGLALADQVALVPAATSGVILTLAVFTLAVGRAS